MRKPSVKRMIKARTLPLPNESLIHNTSAVLVLGDVLSQNLLTIDEAAKDLAWVYSSAPVDCLDSIEDAYDIARSEGVDRHLRERAE
ncbi:MAG: hypothetical protein ACFNLE_03745, partial [Rothia aeria]